MAEVSIASRSMQRRFIRPTRSRQERGADRLAALLALLLVTVVTLFAHALRREEPSTPAVLLSVTVEPAALVPTGPEWPYTGPSVKPNSAARLKLGAPAFLSEPRTASARMLAQMDAVVRARIALQQDQAQLALRILETDDAWAPPIMVPEERAAAMIRALEKLNRYKEARALAYARTQEPPTLDLASN